MKRIKENIGITLIALIITIIILIIFATISMYAILGKNGIIGKAKDTTNNYQIVSREEESSLKNQEDILNNIYDENFNENGPSGEEEKVSEDIYVSLNGNILSFYSNEELARINADSEEHYYGNIKGKEFWYNGNITPWQEEKNIIEKIRIENKIYPTNMNYWFCNLIKLKEVINIDKIDTNKLATIQGMFENCSFLTNLDLSNFDTSNVENMRGMFVNCFKVRSIDVSKFKTDKVKYMNSMFGGCWKLESLNLSSFDTSNVENMENMFFACHSLTSLDLINFNTSKAINMKGMFSDCWAITSINVNSLNWITENADTENMFSECGVKSVTFI
ncbi:MAG: BspA family leucine-rich repeat surface protein [Clostridia bacterium]|nr:BspA family leucine-rich repeat surface protein [Clostridia bacterium]